MEGYYRKFGILWVNMTLVGKQPASTLQSIPTHQITWVCLKHKGASHPKQPERLHFYRKPRHLKPCHSHHVHLFPPGVIGSPDSWNSSTSMWSCSPPWGLTHRNIQLYDSTWCPWKKYCFSTKHGWKAENAGCFVWVLFLYSIIHFWGQHVLQKIPKGRICNRCTSTLPSLISR